MASDKGDGKGKSAHHASTGTLSAVFDAISVELMARRVTLAELYKDIDENRDGQLSFNELVGSGDHRTPSTPATIPTSPTIPTIPTTLPSMAFPPCLTFYHNHDHIYIYTNTIIVSHHRVVLKRTLLMIPASLTPPSYPSTLQCLLLMTLDVSVPEEVIQALFVYLDQDQDGVINLRDIEKAVKVHNNQMQVTAEKGHYYLSIILSILN